MNRLLKTALGLLTYGFFVLPASALILEPGDADYDGNDGSGYGPGNCEVGCINDLFGTSLTKPDDLLYKAEYGGGEEGSYMDSYSTTWSGDPNGATISWDPLMPAIDCPECYLAVKDGNHDPRYYFYDISDDWDGMEDLVLQNFWNQSGAISHVSIWGASDDTQIPEPGTAALLAFGIVGLVLGRRRSR